MFRKIFRQRSMRLHDLRLQHVVAVSIDPRGGGHEPGQQRRARRPADRPRATRIAEDHRFFRKLINVGCLALRMPAKSTHPVIEVVDGDKQNIRLRGLCPQRCATEDK